MDFKKLCVLFLCFSLLQYSFLSADDVGMHGSENNTLRFDGDFGGGGCDTGDFGEATW